VATDTKRVTDHAARVKSGKPDREKALDELDEGNPQTALVFAVLDVAAALRGQTKVSPASLPVTQR
jgi:hypothetical protein